MSAPSSRGMGARPAWFTSMLYRLDRPEGWAGVVVEDPFSVTGSHPELVFYELREQRLCRMSLNLGCALAEYRHARSHVTCRTLEDVVSWLIGCEYVSDRDQFGVSDVWMHPADFELTRRGDCDDHALWAYSRLAQLGYQVRYVVGRAPDGSGHAWVALRAPHGAWLLMETTQKTGVNASLDPDRTARPYLPEWSVDQNNIYHCYQADGSRWVSPGSALTSRRS